MIVELRTVAQAGRVAVATGGVQLPGTPRKDGTPTLSRLVDVGVDFECHRGAVEEVSVLFSLYSGNAESYLRDGELGAPLPTGWMVTAAKFEVAWPTDPQRAALVRSHFGARRKAFNWGLAQVKADMDAKKVDPSHVAVPWNLSDLRKAWNQAKAEVAPWWEDNSKECYSSGLADLVTALGNWKNSKDGTRKGRAVGFPRFKSVRRGDKGRVRFTTGTMRLEDDRRTITVPVIGGLHSMENTRRVQRHLAAGRARILNMTLSQQWGRLFVAVNYAQRTPHTVAVPSKPAVIAGVDLGMRTLATVATIDTVTGQTTLVEYANPAPLKKTLAARRRAGRQLSRRIPGSRGHRTAKAKLSRLDRRCVNLRREASHQLTTELAEYGTVKIEDLDIAAMKRSMGRRAFRRAVSDAAMGLVRPQLVYKTARTGATLVVVDRWFPSSQLHHGHYLPDGTQCRLVGKGRIDKLLVCPQTGELVDRDHNAAPNLRDWPEPLPVGVQLERRSRSSAVPAVVQPETAAQTGDPITSLGSSRKTTSSEAAASSENRTGTATPAGKELRKESA